MYIDALTLCIYTSCTYIISIAFASNIHTITIIVSCPANYF